MKDQSLLEDLKVYDLEEHKAFLCSKKKAKNVEDLPERGYCDEKLAEENEQETVILASFVRSGNSLSRGILERLTGLITGSDCPLFVKLVKDLEEMGFNGEGLLDKRCWIVKTHFPEAPAGEGFYADKVLLVVRNPIDSIVSAFNMTCTGTHDKSMSKEDFERYREEWEKHSYIEFTVWVDFYEFYFNSKIPFHIIRFEDILNDTRNTYLGIMQFLLNKKNLAGTVAEKIIDLMDTGGKAPEVYKPRQGKINANRELFKQEDIDKFYGIGKEVIDKLGYTEIFTGVKQENEREFVVKSNAENLEKAIN